MKMVKILVIPFDWLSSNIRSMVLKASGMKLPVGLLVTHLFQISVSSVILTRDSTKDFFVTWSPGSLKFMLMAGQEA